MPRAAPTFVNECPPIARVLGYARVSSELQGQGSSLRDQQAVIAAHAKAKGLPTPTFFVESESAIHEKNERRERIRALQAEVRAGDLVVCDKIDRWSRDPEFTYRSIRRHEHRSRRSRRPRDADPGRRGGVSSRLGANNPACGGAARRGCLVNVRISLGACLWVGSVFLCQCSAEPQPSSASAPLSGCLINTDAGRAIDLCADAGLVCCWEFAVPQYCGQRGCPQGCYQSSDCGEGGACVSNLFVDYAACVWGDASSEASQ
jgi:Resolvase, N terminal domain